MDTELRRSIDGVKRRRKARVANASTREPAGATARIVALRRLADAHPEEFIALQNEERAKVGLQPVRARVPKNATPEQVAAAEAANRLWAATQRCRHRVTVRSGDALMCRECGEEIG